MSNKKQTAVDFLYERLERMIPKSALYDTDKKQYLMQAKAMHKEQMLDIWSDGNDYSSIQKEEFEQYYNETYENSKD